MKNSTKLVKRYVLEYIADRRKHLENGHFYNDNGQEADKEKFLEYYDKYTQGFVDDINKGKCTNLEAIRYLSDMSDWEFSNCAFK